MSARPHTSDGDSSGTRTLYIDDYDLNSPFPNDYAYADNDMYEQQDAYGTTIHVSETDYRNTSSTGASPRDVSRRKSSPATGRVPGRRSGPPAVRRPTSTPLLLRATVVIGLVTAAGVGAFRASTSTPAIGRTAAAAAVGPGAADPAATSRGSCRVQQDVTSRSPGRFASMLTISNTGQAAVDGWTLTWSYPGAETMPRLSGGWNATVSSDINGGQATAVDLSRVIPANGSTTIGFVGTVSGKVPTPANFALNGVMCR